MQERIWVHETLQQVQAAPRCEHVCLLGKLVSEKGLRFPLHWEFRPGVYSLWLMNYFWLQAHRRQWKKGKKAAYCSKLIFAPQKSCQPWKIFRTLKIKEEKKRKKKKKTGLWALPFNGDWNLNREVSHQKIWITLRELWEWWFMYLGVKIL